MIRRRPSFLTAIKRALPALWLAAALLLQGVPSFPAMGAALSPAPHHEMMAADEAVPPCHDAGDPQPQPEKQPDKPKSMACCSAAICGMIAQALPPEMPAISPVSTIGFDRPLSLARHPGARVPPLLRPPSVRL